MLGLLRRVGIAALVPLATVAPSGCSLGEEKTESGVTSRPVIEREGESEERRPAAETVMASHCPPGLPSCRRAEGRITYVERVDPDGDGDAHFVIVDPHGITLPGLTAIDVSRGLRPHPLPGVGDLISAAGPVQTGSYGQSQIHAIELHVAGRSG
jgi:hypothetical protein